MKSIIEVNHLSKKYKYGEFQPYHTLRDTLAGLAKIPFYLLNKNQRPSILRKDEFWALKDVSFNLKEGEVLGIIGPNGSGKSTLLKIISKITPPTNGEITLRGRVGSLLEVGTGFHPELTGRENIFLNGAILGMTQKEIKRKFDEIVDFSGVEFFLDTPIKHYSSGMYIRLAFAVAANLESEILLVDEVLAVGDIEFQKKCLSKMSDIAKGGRTVIFVSHNIGAINTLCSKCIYLSSGKKQAEGSPNYVISEYTTKGKVSSPLVKYKYNDRPAQITYEKLLGNTLLKGMDYSKEITIETGFSVRADNLKFYMGIEILNQMNETVIFWRDFEILFDLKKKRRKNDYKYLIRIPADSLAPGGYKLSLTLVDILTYDVIDKPETMLLFEVVDPDNRFGSGLPWRSITSIPITIEVKNP